MVSQGRKFLVVDDEESLRELFAILLNRSFPGCFVKTAGNGKEALALVSSGFSPDLIVCDIRMPVMNGMEFFYERKEAGFNGKWLFITGSHFEEEKAFLGKNELDFLVKPFNFKNLKLVVEKLLPD